MCPSTLLAHLFLNDPYDHFELSRNIINLALCSTRLKLVRCRSLSRKKRRRVTLATDNAIARNATISNYELPVLMQNSLFFVVVVVTVSQSTMSKFAWVCRKNRVAFSTNNHSWAEGFGLCQGQPHPFQPQERYKMGLVSHSVSEWIWIKSPLQSQLLPQGQRRPPWNSK